MKKKLLCISIAALMILGIPVTGAAYEKIFSHVSVNSYDSNVDYCALMIDALEDGGDYALDVARVYEAQRNLKIRDMGLTQYNESNYFDTYQTAEEILQAIKGVSPSPTPAPTPAPTPEPDPAPSESANYTDEDLYWLSRVLYAEAGCDWFPDWVQRDVASVVLNRVNDSRYPNTIKGVIFDPGQYGCVNSGSIYRTPTQKCINNARWVLENGSTLPGNIIGQAGYPLGPVYKTYYDSVLGTTIYFFSV